MPEKNLYEKLRRLAKGHPEFVESLADNTRILMQDKTEVYSFLDMDNTLWNIHLTYVYRCKRRHTQVFPPFVTSVCWVPDAKHSPIPEDCPLICRDVANEFMLEMFQIKECYSKEDFGYEPEEEEEEISGNRSCDDPDAADAWKEELMMTEDKDD